MIGVVVPAKNEAAHLDACLSALARAAVHPALAGRAVRICVALDDCSDDSEGIARRYPVEVLLLAHANVGASRRESARLLLASGAEWLASTDADSVVADDWLVAQLAECADAVCGTVEIADWAEHPAELVTRYRASYVDAPGHRHIHGANLGVSRSAYERAGGFPPIAAHEDVALVRALERTGAHIAWSNAPRVVTSARLVARAPAGFAAHLRAQHRAIRRVA